MPQTVSVQQVMAEWRRQGGPARAAPAMARIARRESGLQPRQNGAVNSNGTVDHGLYQINDIWRKDPVIGPLFRSGAIYTLAGNTQAAIHILKVQGPQAWATYNAATDAKYLSGLNFSKKAGSKAAAPAAVSPSSTTIKLPDTQQVSGPAVTPGGQTRQDLLQQYLTTRGQPGALLGLGNNLASLKQQTTTVPGATITSSGSVTAVPSAASVKPAVKGAPVARSDPRNIIDFNILPLARSLGINVTPGSVSAANARHGPTISGGVSDHQGNGKNTWAADMSNGSAPTPQMDKLAASIAKMYGIPWHGSGLVNHTVKVGGHVYRLQLIYRTNTGGNHYNHVHFGVKTIT